MNKIWIVLIIAIFFSGCSLKEVGKPIVKYSIESTAPSESKIKSDKILKISRFKTPAYLVGNQIWYKRESLRTNSYLYSSWNQDFPAMIEYMLSSTLYKSGLFRSVFANYSKSKSDYTLEGEIVKAVQNITKKGANVTFEIRLYLIDSKTSTLISSKDFSYTKECESINAKGAVKAYNSTIKKFSKEVIKWLKKSVKED